jgi:SAM-dependent methyltransferase
MHTQAAAFVALFTDPAPAAVVEIGSRNINGEIRHLFPDTDWYGIDIEAGPGVNEVADGATWQPVEPVDMVVCCEVFEHCEGWRQIVKNAALMLRPGGRLIVTAAGPGRAPHSAVDGGPIRDGEYYENIDPDELWLAFKSAGFQQWRLTELGEDVQAIGRMPWQT